MNSAEWLFHKAVDRYNDGDDTEATLLFQQVIALAGSQAAEAGQYLARIRARADELPFARAVHLWNLNNYGPALAGFRKVVAMDGNRKAEAQSHLDSAEGIKRAKPVFRAFEAPVLEAPLLELDSPPFDPVEQDPVRRTPHLKIAPEPPLQAGIAFEVEIFSDTSEVRPGEVSDQIVVLLPSAVNEFTVNVQILVTGHFTIDGNELGQITIRRDRERSSSAKFKLRVKPENDLAALAQVAAGITALFTYNGQASGKVSRTIDVGGVAGAPPPPVQAARIRDGLGLDGKEAKVPDLTVVIAAQPANDGRQFWCSVRTPLLPQYAEGISGEWNLPQITSAIVTGYMNEFTADGIGNSQRIASLKGAGRKLFAASPEVFRRVFWDLIDAGKLPGEIAIVSEEPFIPWELMLPTRKLGGPGGPTDARQPLGVEFRMGRWTGKDLVSGQRAIPILDSYVIAPHYQGARALPFAQEESNFVVAQFGGKAIAPATFDSISAAFRQGGRTLIHFACHGADDQGASDESIYLENNTAVSATTFLEMDGAEAAFRGKRPLVFLNACEVGRGKPALIGIGGFASCFIDLGASAVIAPLWSVKDDIAHQIARGFYDDIDTKPLAEIMRLFRAKAYDPAIAEDTYASYCFYGDPAAVCVKATERSRQAAF